MLGPKRVTIIGSQVTGNAAYGVASGKTLRVADSTVTGNGFAPQSGRAPVDLFSGSGRIAIRRTTCGTSAGPNGTLGVCAND